MLSLKTGTQNFSSNPQNVTQGIEKNQVLSSAEQEALLGDKNIGEYLNKVADANWVDPAKQRKVGKNALGKDDFLKLMLTQMKNQDPTKPVDSHQMAAQLAQFTSLEQLHNINDSVKGLHKSGAVGGNSAGGGQYQAMNFIGKVVAGDSAKLFRGEFDDEHEFNFNLNEDASSVKVSVINAAGDTVKEYELNDLKKGKNKVSWNGINEKGDTTRPGEYQFRIEAKTSAGRKVTADTKFEGQITGVSFSPKGPVLLMGKQSVRLSDVKKIMQPGLTEDRNVAEAKTQDLSQVAKAKQNETLAPAEGNIKDVPMARGLLNQLGKVK